jgi:RNA polymerase sigma-70 factor (ECF subfamily)
VFLHAMRKLSQLRDVECFPGWLRQITVRMAINRLTRNVPLHKVDGEVLEGAEARGDSPLEQMVRAEQREQLWKALQKLKAMDRATLVAFYIRSQSLQQMSREFETPVGTIKRRLHVARHRLKEQLEKSEALATAGRARRRVKRKRELALV